LYVAERPIVPGFGYKRLLKRGTRHPACKRLDDAIRHYHFLSGSKLAFFSRAWLVLLRYVVPFAIVLVLLHALGII
jgi:hypothetical protein